MRVHDKLVMEKRRVKFAGFDSLLASKRSTNWSTFLAMDDTATSRVKTNNRRNLKALEPQDKSTGDWKKYAKREVETQV